jgi:hypothetical protein
MRISYEDLINDPDLVAKIRAQAQRERAEAVHRLIIAPLKALFAQPPLRETRWLRRSAYR